MSTGLTAVSWLISVHQVDSTTLFQAFCPTSCLFVCAIPFTTLFFVLFLFFYSMDFYFFFFALQLCKLHVLQCIRSYLWSRSPFLGSCACNGVTLPSSSSGSWWGRGPTEASLANPPSPPLWTGGSLQKWSRQRSARMLFDPSDNFWGEYPYWSRWASCQSPASCTAALSECKKHCSWGRNSFPRNKNTKTFFLNHSDSFSPVEHMLSYSLFSLHCFALSWMCFFPVSSGH